MTVRRARTALSAGLHRVPADAVLERDGDYCLGVGYETRGVAIPEDVADPSTPKASGRVRLPDHIGWVPRADREYDLDDTRDLLFFYQELLAEARPDEIRWFVRVEKLVELWDRLLIPSHVQYAWGLWLRQEGFLT